VFDGLAAIQQGDPALSIGVSGFRTPFSGPVRTSVGVAAYEGDRGSAGDRLALNGRLLADAANPQNNLFNSSVSFEGTDSLSQRLPPYVNALGFDSDRIVADGFLANGAASATFEAATTLDQYLIQVVTFTTDLSTPRLAVAKSVTDLDGGDVEPGDVLRYSVTTTNGGDDAATGVVVHDTVPAGTTLALGSLIGPGGSAAADGRTVSFALGTLAPGATTTVGFDVVVEDSAANGFVVRNAASASGIGATAGRPVSAVSPEVTSTVFRAFDADLEVEPERPTAGEPAVADVTITNRLDRPVEDVVATISFPGADVLSATVGTRACSVDDDVARCRLGTLDPGEDATVRVRFRPHDEGVLRPVVTVRGNGVAATRLTPGEIRVEPGRARLKIRERAAVSIAEQGQSVTYRIVVSAGRRAATARRVRVCDVPGAGLRLRSASRRGVIRDGRACWRLGKLPPGRSIRLKAVARVTAATGLVSNAARARGSNLRGRSPVASVAGVRVVPFLPRACAAAVAPRAHAAC
jgi:uncharacterized repeat protein (TIGR01451 family)